MSVRITATTAATYGADRPQHRGAGGHFTVDPELVEAMLALHDDISRYRAGGHQPDIPDRTPREPASTCEATCVECGRSCRRKPDGLCYACRLRTPEARAKHAARSKAWRTRHDRKKHR